jgi:hypothetical protein
LLRNPARTASPPRPFLGKTKPCRSVVPTMDSVTRWGGACGLPLRRVAQTAPASANARDHDAERRIAPHYTVKTTCLERRSHVRGGERDVEQDDFPNGDDNTGRPCSSGSPGGEHVLKPGKAGVRGCITVKMQDSYIGKSCQSPKGAIRCTPRPRFALRSWLLQS